MTFKVIIHKEIRKNRASTWLQRTFELPFAPFIGLELTEGVWSARVEKVYWRNNIFYCYAAPVMNSLLTMEEVVANYLEHGWEIDDV